MAKKRSDVAPIQWRPDIGSTISAYLPHEIVRAQVVSHVDENTISVKLTQPPLAKTHNYRYNQTVSLHRVDNLPMGFRWEADE